MENELFHQLKPRMQKLILDSVFSQFYKTFEIVFEGCEHEFQRELFMHAEYTFYHDENPNEDEEGGHDNNAQDKPDPMIEK